MAVHVQRLRWHIQQQGEHGRPPPDETFGQEALRVQDLHEDVQAAGATEDPPALSLGREALQVRVVQLLLQEEEEPARAHGLPFRGQTAQV